MKDIERKAEVPKRKPIYETGETGNKKQKRGNAKKQKTRKEKPANRHEKTAERRRPPSFCAASQHRSVSAGHLHSMTVYIFIQENEKRREPRLAHLPGKTRRGRAHSLTEPMVMPVTKYFCIKG